MFGDVGSSFRIDDPSQRYDKFPAGMEQIQKDKIKSIIDEYKTGACCTSILSNEECETKQVALDSERLRVFIPASPL